MINERNIYDQIFLDIFQIDKEELPSLKHGETANWDSLTHMELIATIEEKFGIMLEIDDILDFDSWERGPEILKRYGKNI